MNSLIRSRFPEPLPLTRRVRRMTPGEIKNLVYGIIIGPSFASAAWIIERVWS